MIFAHIKKNRNMKYVIFLVINLFFVAGAFAQNKSLLNIDAAGTTISERVIVPEGYIRPPFPETSFQDFLRTLPMKSADATVMKYDGYEKFFNCYAAVLDVQFPMKKDLIHGEHAIQLLRSLYLYKNSKYDLIRYNYDDNRCIDFEEYGYGTRFVWQDSIYVKDENAASEDFSESAFLEYLNDLYNETTARGLQADTKDIAVSDLSVGDLFIQPGNQHSPGHAVLVVDMVVEPSSGERLVLLGQGYSPTQDIHIINNPYEEDISPWYRVNEDEHFFSTVQWTFRKKHCRRFILNANAASYSQAIQLMGEEVTEE